MWTNSYESSGRGVSLPDSCHGCYMICSYSRCRWRRTSDFTWDRIGPTLFGVVALFIFERGTKMKLSSRGRNYQLKALHPKSHITSIHPFASFFPETKGCPCSCCLHVYCSNEFGTHPHCLGPPIEEQNLHTHIWVLLFLKTK